MSNIREIDANSDSDPDDVDYNPGAEAPQSSGDEDDEVDGGDQPAPERVKDCEEQSNRSTSDLWSEFLSEVGETAETEKCTADAAVSSDSQNDVARSKNDSKSADKTPDDVSKTENVAETSEKVLSSNDLKSSSSAVRLNSATKPPESVSTSKYQKRPSGLAALGSLGKKQKISTLEQTKLDWCAFKQDEGIGEDLKHHVSSKDGFLSRQDFLQRSDLRQFEVERTVRSQNSKRRL